MVWRKRFGCNFLDDLLSWQVKNLNTVVCTNDEPVEFLGEQNAVNWRVTILLSQESTVHQIPDHDHTVVGAWSKVWGTNDHVESVDLGLVTGESVHKLHVSVVPDLDGFVPWGSNTDCWFVLVVELDARDSVFMLVLVNGVLAFRTSVPDLNWLISWSSNDLSIIWWDSYGENVSRVAN